MKSITLLLVLSLGFINLAVAQGQSSDINWSDYNKMVDVLPPAPTAASLGKFGGFNMNLSTGMANISLPIYTYSSVNLRVPITLNYSSNGVKVDEIGGRVGMTWTLEAGGVIARTVMGKPDELVYRTQPPNAALYTAATIDYIDNLSVTLENDGRSDAQPDMFSFNFNGYNGRFMLDSSGNPILLTYSNLKIERFSGGSGTYLFKATDGSGVQYFFGGGTASEISSKSQAGTACGKIYRTPVVTAWHLTSIVHPNKDTVYFSYTQQGFNYVAGNSESVFTLNRSVVPSPNCGGGGFGQPTPPPNTSCETSLQTSVSMLKEIYSTAGGKILIGYAGRADVGDSLVSSISVYEPGQNAPFRIFNFTYTNSVATTFLNVLNQGQTTFTTRPFLTGFTESGPDGSLFKTHTFSYNDINGLPPRLSYAQDDYGFFNGKNNTTLIPKPTDPIWINQFPTQATANRNADTNYLFKGLLTKIVYPTGGQDSIVYESNEIYQQKITFNPSTTANVSAGTGSSGPTVTYIDVLYSQSGQLYASIELLPGYSADQIHDKGTVLITDSVSGAAIYNQTMDLNNPSLTPLLTLDSGHAYKMTISATGAGISAAAGLSYIPGAPIRTMANQLQAGARVKKVISSGGTYSLPIVKRYYYSALATDTAPSSASPLYAPTYEKMLNVPVFCGAPEQFYVACVSGTFQFYSMYSNSVNDIYLYSSLPLSYSTVWESFGEAFENGGVRHDYTINGDDGSSAITGDIIIGAPMTSFSWRNGREISSSTFTGVPSTMKVIQKVLTHYNEDGREGQVFSAYMANKKAATNCSIESDPTGASAAFDYSEYLIFQSWVYPDTIQTYSYDQDGIHYLIDTTITQYANAIHALPTSISSTTSQGGYKVLNNYYPGDLTLSGNAETARQELLNEHIFSPILKRQLYRNGMLAEAESTDYNIFPNGEPLPQSYTLQYGDHPAEKRVEFYNYTDQGKILEQSKENDAHNAYIWDYNGMYPTAGVMNAQQSDIAYAGFEADGTGNWSITGGYPDNSVGVTGQSSYVNGSFSKTGLNSSTTYIVSYWSENGPYNIAGTISGYPQTGKTISYNNSNWTLYVHKISGLSTVSFTAAGHIDELRLYPSTAQMTTYTYDPLVGMTSQMDAGNRATYYEYDGLARLKRVRDQDHNILKTIEYQYQAPAGCGSGCYSVAMQTFAGSNTISYPVGVFDVNGKLLGNAIDAPGYVNFWNNDTADSRVGTLALGKDSMHFNITVNAGQTLPSGVTGLRYYQVDLPWNQFDAVRQLNAAYIDFGDGTGIRMPASETDTPAIHPPNTIYNAYFDNVYRNVPGYYFIHNYSYADTSLKTITCYHNDGVENTDFDNSLIGTATSLTKLRNLQGNLPANTNEIGGSCYQQASMTSLQGILNWNRISSVQFFRMNSGDGGINGCTNISYPQDFMANNKGLRSILTRYANVIGVADPTFKLSRLKSDWNTYFTHLQQIWISERDWNHEDLSHLLELNDFALSASDADGSSNPNGPWTPISTAEVDTILNQIAAGAGRTVTNGVIGFSTGGGSGRTSASQAAVDLLNSKGWKIYIDNVRQ